MNLKDRFDGDSLKNFLNKLKFDTDIKAAKASYTIKTLLTNLKAKAASKNSTLSSIKTRVMDKATIADLKRHIVDLRIEKLSKLSRNAKIGIGAGVLGAVVISTALIVNAGPDVYKLTIAGQDAGYLTDAKMVSQAIEEIKADLSQKAGGIEIIADSKSIDLEATDLKAKKVTIMTEGQLKERILSANLLKANVWAVNINGANVVASSTEADANSILDGVKRNYLTEGSELVSAGFKENVVVTQSAMNVADIMKPEDAVNLIVTGTKEPKVYTVQDGDTLWDIAIANGMSPEELQSANPGFNPDKLKIGQQLNLFQIKPYVTVLTKEVVATTEKIDYKVVYENSNALYKGEVKVKTAGVYGTKEIKTELTKENGIVVASAELGSVVTAEPQNQVALKGTKSISTFTGTGTLSNPVGYLKVTDGFNTSRGTRRHTGIDLKSPQGSPVRAADDGVVISITNRGTPGKMIKLSHGNGLETWYEHLGEFKVSVGQVVKKGDIIGTIGRTGNATGYILHFEVRKNGVPQNPLNYL